MVRKTHCFEEFVSFGGTRPLSEMNQKEQRSPKRLEMMFKFDISACLNNLKVWIFYTTRRQLGQYYFNGSEACLETRAMSSCYSYLNARFLVLIGAICNHTISKWSRRSKAAWIDELPEHQEMAKSGAR